jgi:glucose/arabinose dehydrogenase
MLRHAPHRLATALLLALPLAACNSSANGDAAKPAAPAAAPAAPVEQPAQTLASAQGQIRVTRVASGLDHPWSLAFLPDGAMLVTERSGQLRRVGADGAVSAPISGVPKVFATGQGGLLDVVLYAEPGDNGTAGTAVAYGTLSGDALTDVKVIYRQEPKLEGPNHFGSRIVFDDAGHVFISQGERNQRPTAQELDKLQGKLVRLNLDGSVPQDNPFVGRADARPEIYSYGHRNMQGMARDPRTGTLWQSEHGPRGGDEINLPEAGKNYGWPTITYGINYSGQPIPEAQGKAKDGMEQPYHLWEKSPGVSGMAFLVNAPDNSWNNSLFLGALAERNLIRLTLDGNKIVGEERLLNEIGERVRDVRVSADGKVYVLTDEDDGKIWRIEAPQAP